MINNNAFALNEEELERYNKWATAIAVAMGNADIESWTLDVTFSFSNLGTTVVARCASAAYVGSDLTVRE